MWSALSSMTYLLSADFIMCPLRKLEVWILQAILSQCVTRTHAFRIFERKKAPGEKAVAHKETLQKL